MLVPRGKAEEDPATGRLLTEWYEEPEHTEEFIDQKVQEYLEVEPEEYFKLFQGDLSDEAVVLLRQAIAKKSHYKTRKWRHNMTQQEVAMRMNEASKIVNEDNRKFLSPEVQERTGLEMNPLYQLEVLVRSGVLAPKEQIAALKELAQYTHSKTPSLNQNVNINGSPEDFLMEIAKDDYDVIGETAPAAPLYQKRERGEGEKFNYKIERKSKARLAVAERQAEDAEELLGSVDEDFDLNDFDGSDEISG